MPHNIKALLTCHFLNVSDQKISGYSNCYTITTDIFYPSQNKMIGRYYNACVFIYVQSAILQIIAKQKESLEINISFCYKFQSVTESNMLKLKLQPLDLPLSFYSKIKTIYNTRYFYIMSNNKVT